MNPMERDGVSDGTGQRCALAPEPMHKDLSVTFWVSLLLASLFYRFR